LDRLRRGLSVALAAAAALAGTSAAWGEAGGSASLRVGTSGDYPPFSRARDGRAGDYEGLDVTLARAYAADRELALEFVRFRWPRLMAELQAGRFDVATRCPSSRAVPSSWRAIPIASATSNS
jgi:cyclohexadienyl dehydratase